MSSDNSLPKHHLHKSELDIGRLIGEILDHRKLIIGVTSICTLIALIYVLFATPIYRANALVQVEQKQGNAILDSITQVLPGAQPKSDSEISLLQSRMIIGKTVDDLNLQANIKRDYFPLFGKGLARILGEKPGTVFVSDFKVIPVDGKYPTLKLTVIDDKKYIITDGNKDVTGMVGDMVVEPGYTVKVNEMDAEPGASYTITYITKLEAISGLTSSLEIMDEGRETGMLNLTLIGEDQNRISVILNDIVQNYLDQNIDRQAAQSAKSLEFLKIQLPKVRADLDKAEGTLNKYRQQKDSVDLSLEAKSVLDQVVNVDNQLNELVFREAEISQRYTKEHPIYKALIEKRETLNQERNRLNKRVSSMPETQQEVLRLSRDVESGRAIYMQLLSRQQELNIAKSSAIGNVRIVDPAITEPNPVKPQKLVIIALGFVIGFFISAWVLLLKIILRKGIESPQQLEELGINVYASVPISEWFEKRNDKPKTIRNKSSSNNEKIGLLAVQNPADLAIEAIRSLRTSLHFAMMEAKNDILMISGASPNAGKTFVSSNLAAVIAQGGKKVLFVDADMRKGYAHKIFEAKNNVGLSDYLSGAVSKESIIQKISSANIDFISRGMIPPNPSELLMNKRFDSLMEWLSSSYDLVVIDTPPVLAVTDPSIISRCVGTLLMVVRHELNTVPEVEMAIRRFEMNNIEVKGVILNAVVKSAANYYSYGYTNYNYDYSSKE
ncbi:polysaccharide biosynthesis tyrosine autokinase [Klebsiella aerogenes]|uniref:polysaccharide biosynthesis tyrosine autokinase n=1 Tax=Klebsiella aerogenes TaxID=548 RepID=UPI002DB6A35F|nr:polysaccharide biosynthesis tyrosine autokinase [Klebsiella aerogenes]MEB5741690.1 polysaccharide biosynthesis tyrosine autokinase [Klebsiella aerogenes]HBS6038495.1 polysaccharide biosynthesis tyrosine autokinase [Klebsiella aerogenes]HBT3181198.1 polysaccharide biosynthesis tyrosine autokinase [Klebsiella aerogenes]